MLARLGARIVFRPQKKRWPLKLPFENVSFPAPDGRMITGVYLPAQNNRPTLLFFHGRGGNVSHFEKFALAYAPKGYGILMFDYRGFGLSQGSPSKNGV
jgi:predicted alpha/beta hydrolase